MKLIAHYSRDYHFADSQAKANSLSYAQAFTKRYGELEKASIATREAELLKLQFPQMFRDPEAGDLFIGRVTYPCVGFCLEGGGLGFYFDFKAAEEAAQTATTPEESSAWHSLTDFWRPRTTDYLVRQALPPEVLRFLPSDAWTREGGVAFPLYRIGGTVLDYTRLLQLGLDGLEEQARSCLAEAPDFLASAVAELDLIRYTIDRFAAREDISPDIRQTLKAIRNRPPQTLREAIQLLWIYAIHAGTWTYGRLDIILGPFLQADLEAGRIEESDALDLLCSWWQLIHAYANQYSNRIILGGLGRPDEKAADRFALLAIEATRKMRLNQPQLTLRLYNGQNPELWERALDAIGEGCTFPMLYNDEVNIPAVEKAFGVERDIATEYIPFGCGEYVLSHYGVYSPNGVMNMLWALDLALRGGRSPDSGKLIVEGIPQTQDIQSFEQLWEAYCKVVDTHMLALAWHERIEYDVTAQQGVFALASLLLSDCLEKGNPALSGGLRFLGGTIETYGNTNAADSLHAIDELVFRRQRVSIPELVQALDNNFADQDNLFKECRAVTKYGNDEAVADAMAQRVHQHVCASASACASETGLHAYLVVIINNWANTILGQFTGASAEGRKAGQPLANGNNPSSGSDTSGVTAFLNSLTRLDPKIHAGAVQNMKFGKEWFGTMRPKVDALLRTYFAQGGTQAMLTVVSRDDLEQAMREPEKWGHLMVRVGGFSIRFVELPRNAQLEVLQRTLN